MKSTLARIAKEDLGATIKMNRYFWSARWLEAEIVVGRLLFERKPALYETAGDIIPPFER